MRELITILRPEVKQIMKHRGGVSLHNNFLIMGSLRVVYVCLGSSLLQCLMLNGTGTVNSVLFCCCFTIIATVCECHNLTLFCPSEHIRHPHVCVPQLMDMALLFHINGSLMECMGQSFHDYYNARAYIYSLSLNLLKTLWAGWSSHSMSEILYNIQKYTSYFQYHF